MAAVRSSSVVKMLKFVHVAVIKFQMCNFVYQIASKLDDFSLMYGNLTIFKMADLRCLEF